MANTYVQRGLSLAATIAWFAAISGHASAAAMWDDGLYLCRPEVAGLRSFHVRLETRGDDTYVTVPEDDGNAHQAVLVEDGTGLEWGTERHRYYILDANDAENKFEVRMDRYNETGRPFMCAPADD